MAAEVGAGVEVGAGFGALVGDGGRVGGRRAAGERGLGGGRAQRRRAHVHEPDARVGPGSWHGGTPTMAQSWARRLNFWNDQPAPGAFGTRISVSSSVGLQRRLEEAGEEVVDGDGALAARALGHERGPQREQHRGQVGRRVAVGDRAADGAAVAHLRVAHLAGGVAQERHLGAEQVAGLEVAVAGEARRWRRGRRRRGCTTGRDSRPMSMSTDGAASRSFISGSSEWPPASSLASSPCSPSGGDGAVGGVGPDVVEGGGDHAGAPRAGRRPARPSRCCGSRCSGRGCPRGPRARPARSGRGSPRAATPPPSPCPACSSRTGGRGARWKAACTGCIASPSARPSMVVTSRPSACTASTVQHFTDSPSSEHGAGAAARRVAADVRAGEPDVVAQVVHEELPRLDVARCAPSR